MAKQRTESREQRTKKRWTYADYLGSLGPDEQPISEAEFGLLEALVQAHQALHMSVEVFAALEQMAAGLPELRGFRERLARIRQVCTNALAHGTPDGADRIGLTKTA